MIDCNLCQQSTMSSWDKGLSEQVFRDVANIICYLIKETGLENLISVEEMNPLSIKHDLLSSFKKLNSGTRYITRFSVAKEQS